MIKPSIGRKVWYRPSAADKAGNFGMRTAGDQPLDATVLAVWGDRCVNLSVSDIYGKQFSLTSARLRQPGEPVPVDAEGNDIGGYAEWMPYQLGQAAKTGTLEVETKTYADGAVASGPAPLPSESPAA